MNRMNTPDTGAALDLDEIEQRWGCADRSRAKPYFPYTLAPDVPALVAEVRRLRAENERLDALWAETTNDAICETNRANGAEEERLREAVARVESTCGFVAEMAAVADVAGPPATIVVAMAKDILALLHGEPPRATADAVPCEHPPLHRCYSLGKVGVTCSDCGHVWLEQREASKPAADAGEMTP